MSLGMDIDVYDDQNFRWTEVNGNGALSDALPIFIESFLNVCTKIIKEFIIPACIKTTYIDLFIEILVVPVIYLIQFS